MSPISPKNQHRLHTQQEHCMDVDRVLRAHNKL